MKLSELIAEYGDERVQFQALDSCLINAQMHGSTISITFGTEQPLGIDGPIKLGIIVWLDRDEAKKIINPVRADGPGPQEGGAA